MFTGNLMSVAMSTDRRNYDSAMSTGNCMPMLCPLETYSNVHLYDNFQQLFLLEMETKIAFIHLLHRTNLCTLTTPFRYTAIRQQNGVGM